MKMLGAGSVLNLDRIIHQIKPQDVSARANSFTTCAFLNTDSFIELARKNYTIRKEIVTMQKAINLNSLRPYALDYFKTRPRSYRKREIKLRPKRKGGKLFKLSKQQSNLQSQFSIDSEH